MGPSCLWLLQQTYRQWRVGPSWQCPAHLLPQIRTEARPWHKIRAPLELGHPIGAYNPMTVHLSPPPPLPRFEILVALAWEKSCVAAQRDRVTVTPASCVWPLEPSITSSCASRENRCGIHGESVEELLVWWPESSVGPRAPPHTVGADYCRFFLGYVAPIVFATSRTTRTSLRVSLGHRVVDGRVAGAVPPCWLGAVAWVIAREEKKRERTRG